MEEDFDQILPKNHTKRLAKITLYLEVSSDYDEATLETTIEQEVAKLDMMPTGPSETMISEPGSDRPEDFEKPVGFIAPDGKFYLVEEKTSGLAHLKLAPFVKDLYEEKGFDFRPYTNTMGVDYTLELAGFIKVHRFDIRSNFHLPIANIYSQEETTYSPDITQAQVNSVVRYSKLFGDRGDIFVNDKRIAISRIKQADKIQLREIFGI